MTRDVRDFLEKCGLSEYFEPFLAEGFESLDSVGVVRCRVAKVSQL